MAEELRGDACAFVKGTNGQSNRYYKLGMAMQKPDGRVSIKLDTMPLPSIGWDGWINIFWKDGADAPAARPSAPAPKYKPYGNKSGFEDMDDDIPF